MFFLHTLINYYSELSLSQNAGFTMNVKTSDYYGTLYVGIAMNVKNHRLLWDPYEVL
jgi:hypothetical protein